MAPQDQENNRLTKPDSDANARLQGIENKLRWAETLWISNKRPIKGTLVAFHSPDTVDNTHLSCFLLPSLPQLSTDYIALGKMMDPKQPFFGLYLPSEKRNPENTSSVHKLAKYYADEINKQQPDGPLAIGGWSAGGIVARMSAQLLQAAGREVRLLIVIDGALPTVDAGPRDLSEKIRISYNRAWNVVMNVGDLARDVSRRIRQRPHPGLGQATKTAWQHSSLRQNWERTVDLIAKRTGASKPAAEGSRPHPAEVASAITTLPPDHRACAITLYDAIDRYVPQDQYTGEVVLYEATAEPDRGTERVARKWAKISKNLTVVTVKGTHMSIVKPPKGLALAEDLSKRLRELGSRPSDVSQRQAASSVGA